MSRSFDSCHGGALLWKIMFEDIFHPNQTSVNLAMGWDHVGLGQCYFAMRARAKKNIRAKKSWPWPTLCHWGKLGVSKSIGHNGDICKLVGVISW